MNAGDATTGAATLWIVATPIGNRDDLGRRARELLGRVPVIAAEDTRMIRRLLGTRERPVDLVALDEHRERARTKTLIRRLCEGDEVALVSDAGTPLISDPGYRLVAAAHDAGIDVRTVPGPCAAVAALSVAGLPSDRFCFEGFLPPRPAARKRRLGELAAVSASLIFYVPARDLPAVVDDMIAAFGGERLATVARELTKLHETVRRDRLPALAEWLAADADQQRGEAVVVVAGCRDAAPAIDADALAAELARELPPSRAAGVLARLTGMKRRQAWAVIESRQR